LRGCTRYRYFAACGPHLAQLSRKPHLHLFDHHFNHSSRTSLFRRYS
jgi:hypothetical protein